MSMIPANVPRGPETFSQKAWRQCKANPLVPIGCGATVGAMGMAWVELRRGNSLNFNRWLRVRVLAQGVTIFAAVVGAYRMAQTNSKQVEAQIKEVREMQERVGFEARMKEAEETHAAEGLRGGRIADVGGWRYGGRVSKEVQEATAKSRGEPTPVDHGPGTSSTSSQSGGVLTWLSGGSSGSNNS